jgi:peptidoglycan/LPS O-acetylase OafA/YrhL
LRACAITLVFLAHSIDLPSGWLGVQLFFVLSGYLITPILVSMRESLPKGFFLAFYGRRALRIFPAYYLYLLVMVPVCYGLIEWAGWKFNALTVFQDQLFYAVFYLYNFFHASSAFAETSMLTHFWSLAVEEQIYLIWPLLIAVSGPRRLIPVLVGIACAGPFLRAATWLWSSQLGASFFHPEISIAVYVLPWSHLDAFAIGGLAALWPRAWSRSSLVIIWIVIAGAGFASEFIATGNTGALDTLGYGYPMSNGLKFLWGYSLLNLGFASLIQHVERSGLGTRVLEWRPIAYIGRISYGLYIVHFPVIFLVNATLLQWGYGLGHPLAVPLAIGFSLALAGASHRYVEVPIMGLKDRLFPRSEKGSE